MRGGTLVAVVALGWMLGGCGPLGSASSAGAPKASHSPCTAAAAGIRAFEIKPGQAEASYTAQEQITLKQIQDLLKITTTDNTAVGRTRQLSGEIDMTRDYSLAAMRVTADLRTLTSDSSLRDERIRNEFLESNRYPWAVFTAAGVPTVSGSYSDGTEVNIAVPGQLTVRGITKPFRFNVTATLVRSTITGAATGSLRMVDFGFDPPAIAGAIQVKEGLAIRVTFTASETKCSHLQA